MRAQRRARRFSINLEILEINGKPAQGARILDLSTNGARLELPFSFRIKDQLKLIVLLPGLKKPSAFIGVVIWKKPANSEGHYITGLQFYQNFWDLDQWLRQLTFVGPEGKI
jgi:hypothetical protein